MPGALLAALAPHQKNPSMGAAPYEFDSKTPDGVQLVRVYRDDSGSWPDQKATPDGLVYVYPDGAVATEKELAAPEGTAYSRVYAIYHPKTPPSFGAAGFFEFINETPEGVQLVRVYRDFHGNWPKKGADEDGEPIFTYPSGALAVGKELPSPDESIYYRTYALYHPDSPPRFGGSRPRELHRVTEDGDELLVRVYPDLAGSWPDPVRTPAGPLYVYPDGEVADERTMPGKTAAGFVLHVYHPDATPSFGAFWSDDWYDNAAYGDGDDTDDDDWYGDDDADADDWYGDDDTDDDWLGAEIEAWLDEDDELGSVRYIPQLSAFFHTGEAVKKRREIIRKTRTRGKPKFPGGLEGMYREVKDPYGPGTISEETPEYKRWREKVYTPWMKKRYKATRWWKKSPERKKWRTEARTRFQKWRRRKIKGKLKEARTKKRKGPFKKLRKKSSVWWEKQRLKLIPKSSKKAMARLTRQRQERQAAKMERQAARSGRPGSHSSGRPRYGLAPFDNDDGTWLTLGMLALLGGIGFFF